MDVGDRTATRRAVLTSSLAAAPPGAISPAFAKLPQSALSEYSVSWNPDRLDALRRQIRAFRFPRAIPGSDWRYGVDPDYLRALVGYWGDGFDMEGAAGELNRFPQYVTRIEDFDIHFIRVIGEGGPAKAR